MANRLATLLSTAQSALDDAEQDRLAEVIEAFLESRDHPAFTAEEMAHLRQVAAEPFIPADPARVRALIGQ